MTWRDVIEIAIAAPIGFAAGWRFASWRRHRKRKGTDAAR